MALNEDQNASGRTQDPESCRCRVPVVLSKARRTPTGQIVNIDISEAYAARRIVSGNLRRVSHQEPVAGL